MNPLLRKFNQHIAFSALTTQYIAEATQETLKQADLLLADICQATTQRTFDNTMLALDNLYNTMSNASDTIFLMAYVHPDKAIRDESQRCVNEFNRYSTDLSLNEQLYMAVKDFSLTAEAAQLTGWKQKFTTETVRDFERNGFALSPEKREELKVIKNKLSETGVAFTANIGEYKDEIIITEAQTAGLPDDYKAARRTADGGYRIDLSYPSYLPFMKYAADSTLRQQLYIKFNNRSADKNLSLLDDMVHLRHQMATMLGYRSYAAYRIEDRMAKTPETVWDFEKQLRNELTAKAKADYAELLAEKQKEQPQATTIDAWEASYYANKLLKSKYEIDEQELKQYFPLQRVLDGIFEVNSRLFGIEVKKVSNADVWHPDVTMYQVLDGGKEVGRFYLDLFPREGKYGHAASFSMIPGKLTAQVYQIPCNTLVCNFPAPTADRPSLLTHREAETMFHEAGHLMHSLLTRSPLSCMAGTKVARDFVEVPSQLAEHWANEYEALQLYAHHWQTNEVLPLALHQRMTNAKNFGQGLSTQQQVFYGMYDMTLHDGYIPAPDHTTTDVLRRLQNDVTMYTYVEGTHFQAAFGHLNGYAAGYYGYLWALVYAEDIFSVFLSEGIFNQAIGKRYLDEILSRGGSDDEYSMVCRFLQREPNNKAFIRSLGL